MKRERTGQYVTTTTASLKALEELGITHEATGQQRGRLFVYKEYIAILNQGTEPL